MSSARPTLPYKHQVMTPRYVIPFPVIFLFFFRCSSSQEKEVKEAIERAKVHLAQANKQLDPHSVDRDPRVELQKTKAALADVTAACRTGNPTAVRAALDKAKAQAQTASSVTRYKKKTGVWW